MTATPEHQRLSHYYSFDAPIADRAAEVADRQRRGLGITAATLPTTDWFEPKDGKPIEVLDIVPENGYENTVTYCQPLGTRLDPNVLYRLGVLGDMLPDTRLIAVGEASGPFFPSNKLSYRNMLRAMKGDLRGKVSPLLEYLESQGIDKVSHIGYSAGSELAVAAAERGKDYIDTERVVTMEPASVEKLPLALGRDTLTSRFFSSGGDIRKYIEGADSPEYTAVRPAGMKEVAAIARYSLGLLRPSNIAMSKHLSNGQFEPRMAEALQHNPGMTAGIVWGTASELAINSQMEDATQRLRDQYPGRVDTYPIQGGTHAMTDDPFLHNAYVAQALVRR